MPKPKEEFRIPPQDLDAEVSVLGSLMLDRNAIIKTADILLPNDFYHPTHQKIYEVILELFEKNKPIDLLTVSHELKGKKQFKDIGGSQYLADILSRVPTSAHIVEYANVVRENRVRRDLINASSEINEKAMDKRDFDSLLDDVEQKIFGISQRSRTQRFIPIKDELSIAYERLEKLHRGEKNTYRGIPTGFTKLDNLLSGFQRSDLILLGARPSYGKTSLALDIARQTALMGHIVGLFSLEMSRDQVIDRFIASQAQIPLWRLRSGRLNDELEFSMVQQALDELSGLPIFIDDAGSSSVLQMRSMARRLQLEHGLDLVIIDYLQLIQPRTNSDNMVQQITEVSRGLKTLARELNVPVLALSQLSRDVEKRETKVPRLSDLRDSGSLEQDADVVMFIHRKDRERTDLSESEQNLVDLMIQKHRNGPLGTVQLRFDSERVTFKNIDTEHAPPEGE
ncbi:MAG: replicative DNA helicase [Patescibacteria group bacterium]